MLRASLLILILLAAPAFAQLVWEKPSQQFHRSPADGHLDTTFAFQNAGAGVVTIQSVKTSCGCTTARLANKLYAPGERGEVTAKFVFGDRRGAHRKNIMVKTDDGKEQALSFLVVIQEVLSVTPALVFWKVGQPPEPRLVQLTAELGSTVRVKSVTSSNPRIAATLETVRPGGQYTVSITPADTMQKEAAEITVQTDFPADTPKAYTVHARIK